MEYRQLVKNESPLSILGFGCMRLPLVEGGEPNEIDEVLAQKMVDRAIEAGVNYFDTAYRYVGGNSETFVGRALAKHPRESFRVATKLPIGMIDDFDTAVKIYYDQQARLNLGYIDFYLLHGINRAGFQKVLDLGILDFLIQKKIEGEIRHLGFSFHGSYEDFEFILNYRKWDFCQIQLNYMDTEIQAGVKGTKLAEKLGVPLVIMEPVKGGSLASFNAEATKIMKDAAPDKSLASWAVRWVAAQSSVAVVLSGMSDLEQMNDNIATFENYKPLTEEENEIIEDTAAKIRASVKVGCTGCEYCMPCPFGVNIPRSFAIWNEYGMYNNAASAKFGMARLKEGEFASFCQKCGACESKCPQELKIRDMLELAANELSAL